MNALGIDPPKNGQIVSPSSTAPGEFSVFEFKISDYIDVVQSQMDNLEAFVQKPKETRPIPCQFCDLCRYKDHCRTELKNAKSIFELPYATKLQEERLRGAGILSLDYLSSSPPRPTSITPKTYQSLVKRAQLRLPRLGGGEASFEYVGPGSTGDKLELIPASSDHDIFFDIEGDPFVDGGLEYLFGLLMGPKAADEFIDIWPIIRAHRRHSFLHRFVQPRQGQPVGRSQPDLTQISHRNVTRLAAAFRGRRARLARFAGNFQFASRSDARHRKRASLSALSPRASSLPRGDGRAWRRRPRRAPSRNSSSS